MNHGRTCIGALALLAMACSQPATPAEQDPGIGRQVAAVDTPLVDSTPPPVTAPALDSVPKPALLGQISPGKDTAFALIAQQYTTKSGIYMRKAAYDAFVKMHAAAAADGVKLTIISATRTFADQKNIWENKWNGQTLVGGKNLSTAVPDPVERAKTILRYSSMPGSSRHHWGTDVDLNSLENSYFDAGQGKKTYDWLVAHAAEYGFCQPYSPIGPDRPHGYQEERWHWSYMPIAAGFLRAYRAQVTVADIAGFRGAETAAPIDVIAHYVGGIAPPCRDW